MVPTNPIQADNLHLEASESCSSNQTSLVESTHHCDTAIFPQTYRLGKYLKSNKILENALSKQRKYISNEIIHIQSTLTLKKSRSGTILIIFFWLRRQNLNSDLFFLQAIEVYLYLKTTHKVNKQGQVTKKVSSTTKTSPITKIMIWSRIEIMDRILSKYTQEDTV